MNDSSVAKMFVAFSLHSLRKLIVNVICRKVFSSVSQCAHYMRRAREYRVGESPSSRKRMFINLLVLLAWKQCALRRWSPCAVTSCVHKIFSSPRLVLSLAHIVFDFRREKVNVEHFSFLNRAVGTEEGSWVIFKSVSSSNLYKYLIVSGNKFNRAELSTVKKEIKKIIFDSIRSRV